MSRQFSIVFVTFLTIFTAPFPVAAQVQAPMTAFQLQALCLSKYDIDAGICAGYVTAVAERLMNEGDPARRVCLSPNVSPQTLVVHLEAAWRDQPPEAQDSAVDSVDSALRRRFRCP